MNDFENVTKQNVKTIGKLLSNGELIPFVGAGASINAGAAILDTLIEIFQDELEEHSEQSSTFIAQFYENKFDRRKLERTIKENIQPASDDTNLDVQMEICKWPVDTIITTNFDNYLEAACDRLGVDYQVFTFQDLTEWHSYKGLKIFKIHGSFETQKVIITENDYQNYETEHPITFKILETLFHTRPMLFIGCSLTDENFRRVFHRVRANQNKQSKFYAILKDITAGQSCMWRNLSVDMMDLNWFDGKKSVKNTLVQDRKVLVEILEQITDKSRIYANSPKERQDLFNRFEKPFSDKKKQIKIIRKSVPLGFLSTPEKGRERSFEGFPDEKERVSDSLKRKKAFRAIIDDNKKVRLIVSIEHQTNEHYGKHAYVNRLKAIRQFISDYESEENFEVVNALPETPYENITIYNSSLMLESRPVVSKKYDDYIDVIQNNQAIRRSIERFDMKFAIFLKDTWEKMKKNDLAKKMDDFLNTQNMRLDSVLKTIDEDWQKELKNHIVNEIDKKLLRLQKHQNKKN